ncbi:MAG TPA: hypothetical protein VF765_27525 [Polyangiaceae bacterium]
MATGNGEASPPAAPAPMVVQVAGSPGMQSLAGPPAQPAMHDVTLRSDSDGTRLLRVDTLGMFFAAASNMSAPPSQEVCVAPCVARLTPSATYMVRGYAINDSAHFGINDATQEVDVHTGSATLAAVGGTATTFGVLGLLAGGSFLTVGLLEPPTNSDRGTFQTVGWAGLAGGAALLGIGLALGLTSVTHVYDGQGARLAKDDGIALTPRGIAF